MGLKDKPYPSTGQIPERAIGESAREIAHMSQIEAPPLRLPPRPPGYVEEGD